MARRPAGTGGAGWTAALGARFRTPGFDVNDAGFQQNADHEAVRLGLVQLQRLHSRGACPQWNVGFNPNSGWISAARGCGRR
jgi:hypothetical protein